MSKKEEAIKFGNEIIANDVDDAELKPRWIKQVREFLDQFEKDDTLVMQCGIMSVAGFEDISTSLPEGLTEAQRKTLIAESKETVRLKGASIGSYPKLIEACVQTGLGLAPQALLHHQRTECHSPDCNLNDENCIAIPASDMMMDIMGTAVFSMQLEAATAVVKTVTEKFPQLRVQFVQRMREEDPAAFAKAVEASGIPDEIKERVLAGDVSPLTTGPDGRAFRVMTGKAVIPMLKAALESGAVPEEHREDLIRQIAEMEADDGETAPDELPAGTTFVPGSKTHKH